MTTVNTDIEEMPRIIIEQALVIEEQRRKIERLEEALAKSHDFHGDQARAITAAEARVARLKDAAWQCLDDMGKSGHCVCEAAKAQLREAYGENGEDDPLDYTLDDARAALTRERKCVCERLGECDGSCEAGGNED